MALQEGFFKAGPTILGLISSGNSKFHFKYLYLI